MSSVEKKRLRDRRAQQNLRSKRSQQMAVLEKEVAHCREHHDDHGIQRLLQVITGLREQNKALRSHQERLKCLVNSWDASPVEVPTNTQEPRDQSLPGSIAIPGGLMNNIDSSSNPIQSSRNNTPRDDPNPSSLRLGGELSHQQVPHTQTLSREPPTTDTSLIWKQLPLHADNFLDPRTISCPWLEYPERIALCPNSPSSPLDLLYGTNTNYLADMIYKATQRRPIRDPERLAMGWLCYHLTRWVVSPSPATYANLPLFLRPVPDQLQITHPMVLDNIPWPQLRVNLIRHWDVLRDIRDDVFGLFSCCVKIRWPWGEGILERNSDNELCIKEKFFETFMSEAGWGLTPEFMQRYPQLLAGVDLGAIAYELVDKEFYQGEK
ncbi:hypothetical protein ANOM_003165 [Aspergillus nomiae NRRL 13137]|uniref:BZIP transcription factor n=1 Tax=Aspergillus nomiae NRRL (strain ATCC 15546 / NRRL 13137 / CBS 260.88 / M93) TaxID=1509407 RepID=A0A0L1JCH7_ASPN3|nr:uncharacterized protein ANOM_003165 [Aspergillus nomiae NRRL 13137]KNG89444.1 hypothetical protein ANOM_003165 [Aspergillus nomiae NRRL 13137]